MYGIPQNLRCNHSLQPHHNPYDTKIIYDGVIKLNKSEQKRSEQSEKKKQRQPLNKKRKNNKVLKAKEILALNKAVLEHETEKRAIVEQRSLPRRIARVVKNVLSGLLIAVLAVTLISFLVIRFSGGTPAVFGYSIQRISSGSMQPTLEVGDIILSKSVTSPEEIAIDNIITFKGDSSFEYNNVTHRVVVPPMQDVNGEYVLTTKGDANSVADKEIPFSWVEFKYVRTLGFLSEFFDFFLSPWGLIVFIAALLIIFFDELMTVVRVMTGNYHEDDEESVGEIMKRLKKEEVEAFLKFQEEQERKRKRRLKHNNTSKKKMKNRKKLAKLTKNTTELENGKENL